MGIFASKNTVMSAEGPRESETTASTLLAMKMNPGMKIALGLVGVLVLFVLIKYFMVEKGSQSPIIDVSKVSFYEGAMPQYPSSGRTQCRYKLRK